MGVGCHPRKLKLQEVFDAERFGELAERAAIVGLTRLGSDWLTEVLTPHPPSG